MMPVLFVGHGSPMNAIEENTYTKGWREIAAAFPKPQAICAVSAHWVTKGTKVCTAQNPATIHDFYGFPKALYDKQYPAPGSPGLAYRIAGLLKGTARQDEQWGLDHGAWSVLSIMYPDADIPVCQLSIDGGASPAEQVEMGKKLAVLREQDVLLFGSGNVVHNLGAVDFDRKGGYDWAKKFDDAMTDAVLSGNLEAVTDYKSMGEIAYYAVPTTEHFVPLLYVLGASSKEDKVSVFNRSCTMGSLSMTSYLFL